ncbi:MAG TPA: hypothetical protein VF631_00785 [Allosphingosinicella sp.]|jgi:hypothetical protein|uniref:hypothetical protein n=1 Tax=Allosphingosinicella sp. TaxID=2823234 RepID=UPI002F299214
MTAQTAWWTLAALGAALGVVSALADWKRTRRRNLDRPGWVPWTGLQLLGVLVTVVAAALALKG